MVIERPFQRRESAEGPSRLAKVLMYSHDTFGLGHIRRSLAIAGSLRKSPANILILTGSPLVGRFEIPSRIDFVRIPGMIKVTNEQYLPLSMKLEATRVLEIRKSIILATAKAFQPEFFLVDKAPLGMKREVVDTLDWLRAELPSCRTILGLRDIMDSASSTIDDWQSKGIYDAMRDLYDELWVYGDQTFYDPVEEYRIPPDVAAKVWYTGYIRRRLPTASDVTAIRRDLKIGDGERVVLLTLGGGGDGYPVVDTFLRAFKEQPLPNGTRGIVVTGPFLSPRDFREVAQRAKGLGIHTLKFHPYMEALIGSAHMVVSMGGYNTICEIMSQQKPFLIVPRTVPREEQLIRAQVLCRRGLCDYLHPCDLSPKTLYDKVVHLLNNGEEFKRKMKSFPFMGLDVIRQRIVSKETEKRMAL